MQCREPNSLTKAAQNGRSQGVRYGFPELSFEPADLAARTAKLSIDLSIKGLSKCPNSND
jgi:hypothetical protein